MRIDVLNGVNLSLLGRRDQAIYGDQSIQDLETQIYAWARELDLQVRCRQTNHEGEYVGFLHQALGTADGLIVNPGRLDALLLGDPRRARAVRRCRSWKCTCRTSTSARSGAAISVLTGLGGMRIVGKGFEGYREALELLERSAPDEPARAPRGRRSTSRCSSPTVSTFAT